MIDELLGEMKTGEIALIEYEPTSSPEMAFHRIVEHFLERDVPVLVVDVLDTLHTFNEHLKRRGLHLPVEKLTVVKEGGRIKLGNVIGEVFIPSEPSEFTYHQVQYSKTVRPFFEADERPKAIIVLGMEKFILPFQNDLRKVEMYFEIIERPLIAPGGKYTFLFINRAVANEYVLKNLEGEKHYVLELSGEARVTKTPFSLLQIESGLLLVEYGSKDHPELVLGSAIDDLRAGNVLVVDVADTGMVVGKHLEAMEWDVEEQPRVVKIGGRVEWGKTIATLDVYNEPAVFLRKLDGILKGESPKVVLYFGMERIPRFHRDPARIILTIANRAAAELTAPYSAVYLINRDVAPPELRGLLEETAEGVIAFRDGGFEKLKG
ncbi:DUF257 family protein [Thermococcus sp. AM4]|uniref:DUF257 family protein n=1 Tax=Thermococcus sp. (strain AM4) TaxID=246969 RepID=UPI0001871364|nr:DUF257 family protein [Thermococcus sp. AM4]EEB73666.1 conserved hypothetical protein [Thermococcus sp. AM4]